MIRALNYPEGVSVPIILDLVFENTEELGHALIRFNPLIAQVFTPQDIATLMNWYADGDDSEEDYVTLELLPRFVDVIAPTWLGETFYRSDSDTLEKTIRDFAGSIGGQSSEFYSQFCASERYEAWRQGRLYATILGIDDDGDYRTGDLYIPFWMTDQLLPVNQIVPLRDFEFLFREQDLRDEIYQSLKQFLRREGFQKFR
tara:strand:- start:3751 stop:4353 length:603 start_codon:yes stop_codon:yes gene_type:complete